MAINLRQRTLLQSQIARAENDRIAGKAIDGTPLSPPGADPGGTDLTPLVSLAFATTPQFKTFILPYITHATFGAKSQKQAIVTARPAQRALEDTADTQELADWDAIITELG